MDFAYRQTATRRRVLRQYIRQALGTSRDPAPHAYEALRAVLYLSKLVHDATGGRFSVRLVDRINGGEIQPSGAIASLHEIEESLTARPA